MRNYWMVFSQKHCQALSAASLPVLLLWCALFVSACSAPPSPRPQGPTPPINLAPPSENAAALNRGPAGDAKQDLIARASEILAAGTNPFFSKLPKPKLELPAEGGAEATTSEPPPVADAFENFQLLGVVMKGAQSMALLALGENAGTEMVRAGDMFFANGNQFSVKSITPSEISVQKLGPAPEVRVLPLPSIVGYGKKKEEGTASASGSGMPEGYTPSVGAPRPTSEKPILKLDEL